MRPRSADRGYFSQHRLTDHLITLPLCSRDPVIAPLQAHDLEERLREQFQI